MNVTNFEKVGDFMEAFGQEVLYIPTMPDFNLSALRLDLIEEEGMKELAMTRRGMILFHFIENDAKTLTFRELLDLLPEDKKKGKIKWKDLK